MKKIISILSLVLLMACGSSEKVIMEDGRVYEVKGSKFFSNGVNVTEQLTANEKEIIKTNLQKRLEAEKIANEKQETIEAEQQRLETIQEEAKRRQKVLEKEQELLEEKLEAKEDARNDFLEAKERLQSKQEKYQRLKDKGKLSPLDEEKWKARFLDLEADIEEANQILKNLK
ncbi:hypothetical protein ACGK9U_10230 [Mariniflexile sp. HNIBRBA6329]|uniref:hypothetical protein n=1 Tax=Mariniflexile sp. HNIBRBA6329 TaxID=3373088 RepID=UPI003745702D